MVDPNTLVLPTPEEPISREIAGILGNDPKRFYDITDLTEAALPAEYRSAQAVGHAPTRAWELRQVTAPISMAVEHSFVPRYLHAAGLQFQTGLFVGLGRQHQLYRAIPAESELPLTEEIPAGSIEWAEPVADVSKYRIPPIEKKSKSVAINSLVAILHGHVGTGYRYDELIDMIYPEEVGQAIQSGEGGTRTLRVISDRVGKYLGGESSKVGQIVMAEGLRLQRGKWVPDDGRLSRRPRTVVRAIQPGLATSETEEYRTHMVFWE